MNSSDEDSIGRANEIDDLLAGDESQFETRRGFRQPLVKSKTGSNTLGIVKGREAASEEPGSRIGH